MEQLKETFEGRGSQKGFIFSKVKETDKGFIYSKQQIDGEIYYEIFRRKVSRARPDYGKPTDYITYPSDESFGKWAWTTKDYERANNILKSL